jgi:hypothetical protein
MTPRMPYVSVVDPIGPAIERVKTVLFRPFSLERWLVIGFCAWLAYLGQRGGGGGGGGGGPHGGGGAPPDIQRGLGDAKEFLMDNLYWIAPTAILVLVVVIGLMLVIAWLRSRGQFMFLYCVAQNKAEVKNPWRQFRAHGNSLFAFRVVVGIIVFVVMAVLLGLGGMVFYTSWTRSDFNAASIIAMVVCGTLAIAAGIAAALVGKFTKDFVVPIMYLHTPSAVQGWHILLDLFSLNKARFLVYLLFQIVILLAISSIVIAAICVTCCCALCILAIPYVGTVLMLPLLVFQQAYVLYYLAQYGPQFNTIAPEVEVIPPATLA